MYKIGEMSKSLGVSIDTLRYYEKINLLPRVHRNNSGIRLYDKKDISRMKFIKRSQKMGFSLVEIKQLMTFRDAPQKAKPEVRLLADKKLQEIESHLKDLKLLQKEFRLLINLCTADAENCPILDAMEKEDT